MADDVTPSPDIADIYSPALRIEVVQHIANHLTPEEAQRFLAELIDAQEASQAEAEAMKATSERGDVPDTAPVFAALDRIVTVIRAWQLSVGLPEHSEWHDQRAAAEMRWETTPVEADLGSISDLRQELLRGGSPDGDLIQA